MAVHMRPRDRRRLLACNLSTLEISSIIGFMGIGESQFVYVSEHMCLCAYVCVCISKISSRYFVQKCES